MDVLEVGVAYTNTLMYTHISHTLIHTLHTTYLPISNPTHTHAHTFKLIAHLGQSVCAYYDTLHHWLAKERESRFEHTQHTEAV
jgi:hypothetical protein